MRQSSFLEMESGFYYTMAPDGSSVQIPIAFDESTDPYLVLKDPTSAYFEREGYVVIRIPPELCDAASAAFESEVKPHPQGVFYRHETDEPARHVFKNMAHEIPYPESPGLS